MIHGRFCFTRTQNGNLLGEYSNQQSQFNATECAELQQEPDEDAPPFVGTYRSTWLERDGPDEMTLRIATRSTERGTIYTLTWARGTEVVFFGEAFVFGEILVGNYWDKDVDGLHLDIRTWR
ncbi:MAG TPA: hypothetical protein VK183_02310 [Flavobacterium sp.]|nr:hypothetical protein [Flavobacterium sp.]